MEDDLFQDLVQSLKEAKAIKKGEIPPSRHFVLEALDVRAIRIRTGLSQREFAKLIQISTRTLQNWEQRRRTPTGPAAALLRIVANEPEIALRSLQHPD
ncbi:MAG: NadS family protein [Thiolinea sp.]